ncbi:hypothetical protein [Rubellicoccus peritrichatus]|uniref:Uncharacterized protein n=1 Tax=Rubellicoccus peritrichatus TaxID=3080537 RepID=A0AAQ3LB42_9BACT|nr:hypothetical protein [Puniceicoccus sp. CR14]WOO41032.1 hypothetical protein RZN69_20625 [Puniceicoccus sp. CR14]
MQTKASSVNSASNLRQIGSAIQLFANDNKGQLPGPVNSGQPAEFGSPNPQTYDESEGTYTTPFLAVRLYEYLPVVYNSGRVYSETFDYPAWNSETNGVGPSYYINREVRKDGISYYPLGIRRSSSDPTKNGTPLLLSRFATLGLDNEVWIYEVDQMAPIGSPGWSKAIPTMPVHGSYRNALLFDGSVSAIPIEDVGRLQNPVALN